MKSAIFSICFAATLVFSIPASADGFTGYRAPTGTTTAYVAKNVVPILELKRPINDRLPICPRESCPMPR